MAAMQPPIEFSRFASTLMPDLHEPDWFGVIGGPPPVEVVLRDAALCSTVLFGALLGSTGLGLVPRLAVVLGAAGLASALYFLMRWRWRAAQKVRIVGNVLEHRDGRDVVRVALNRAVLSVAAASPDVLVLMLDDGRSHVTVARRAEDGELTELPPCLGAYLELHPEDFEAVRSAAQRSYPQA